MLSALQTWFADQLPNRRLYPRRRGPFRAWLRGADDWEPIIGVDISPAGIGLMSLQQLPWGETSFAAEVLGQRIEFRGESVWVQEGMLESKRVWRGGFRTGSIVAQAWRVVLDFCNQSLPPEEHVSEPPVVRIPQDDLERVLPAPLRERVLDMLTQRQGASPNGTRGVQFSYGGVVNRGDRVLHKLAVASNMLDATFYFDDALDHLTMDHQ